MARHEAVKVWFEILFFIRITKYQADPLDPQAFNLFLHGRVFPFHPPEMSQVSWRP